MGVLMTICCCESNGGVNHAGNMRSYGDELLFTFRYVYLNVNSST